MFSGLSFDSKFSFSRNVVARFLIRIQTHEKWKKYILLCIWMKDSTVMKFDKDFCPTSWSGYIDHRQLLIRWFIRWNVFVPQPKNLTTKASNLVLFLKVSYQCQVEHSKKNIRNANLGGIQDGFWCRFFHTN